MSTNDKISVLESVTGSPVRWRDSFGIFTQVSCFGLVVLVASLSDGVSLLYREIIGD